MSEEIPKGLAQIFREINVAYDTQLYFLAIAVTLTVPDLCAAAEFDDLTKHVTKSDYVSWCERYLPTVSAAEFVSGDDIFHLRGGLIHKGYFKHNHRRFAHVAFCIPETQLNAHRCIHEALDTGEKVLFLILSSFISEMQNAAMTWWHEKSGDFVVVKNCERMLSRNLIDVPFFGAKSMPIIIDGVL